MKQTNNILFLCLRYLLLLLIAVPNFYLFYKILTPLTLQVSYFLLSLFFQVELINNTLIISEYFIDIIPACVAASAYYLLLILNLTIPMQTKQRIKLIPLSLLILFSFNIVRIFIFSILFVNDFVFFEVLHYFFWYFLSIFIVVGIWFFETKIFKIKAIPFYTDIKFLIKQLR